MKDLGVESVPEKDGFSMRSRCNMLFYVLNMMLSATAQATHAWSAAADRCLT